MFPEEVPPVFNRIRVSFTVGLMALSLIAGAFLTLLGVAWLVAAAPGVPRGWGWPILAVGIIRVALPLWGRHIDKGKLSERDKR